MPLYHSTLATPTILPPYSEEEGPQDRGSGSVPPFNMDEGACELMKDTLHLGSGILYIACSKPIIPSYPDVIKGKETV